MGRCSLAMLLCLSAGCRFHFDPVSSALSDGSLGDGMGDGAPADAAPPVNNWSEIAAGGAHTCAIMTGGRLWCWGQGTVGQLGTGELISYSFAHAVDAAAVTGTTWTHVATGGAHSCGIRDDGSLWCWGQNDAGQLGNGGTMNQPRPTRVGAASDWVEIAGGGRHTCGRRADGTAWCWGDGTHGERGDGATTATQPTPVQVSDHTGTSPWSDWIAIAANDGDFTCGLRSDGTAWCWGNGTSGQRGDNLMTDAVPLPQQVLSDSGAAGWTNWTKIAAGGEHACGTRTDGSAWCWGFGGFGRLGDGDSANKALPVRVGTALTSTVFSDWVEIHAAGVTSGITGHSCGRRSDGSVWCWGGNEGTLGVGDSVDRTTPVRVLADDGGTGWSDWVSITVAGYGHSCGLRADGTGWCWGSPADGKLGDGTGFGANQVLPRAILFAPPITSNVGWSSLTAGGDSSQDAHTCGIRTDGTAWCWGYGVYGELGNGANVALTYPVPVSTAGVSGTTWTLLTASNFNTCGVRDDRTAWCWGDDSSGQLGDGGAVGQATPVRVKDNVGGAGWTDWMRITPGQYFTCGVRMDGSAWCWGEGTTGELGNNGTGGALLPTRVGTTPTGTLFSDWVDVVPVDVGLSQHACGLRSNGTAWCWGDNSGGKLGDGTTTMRLVPTQVLDDTGTSTWSDWTAITVRGNGNANAGATCGLRADKSAWCWGQNIGMLPVRVGTAITGTLFSDWIAIDAGGSDSVAGSTCGIRANGTAWCWGSNSHGQLGNGVTSNTPSPIPVQVLTDTGVAGWSDWTQIVSGDSQVCGLRTGGIAYCWGYGDGGQLGTTVVSGSSLPTKL